MKSLPQVKIWIPATMAGILFLVGCNLFNKQEEEDIAAHVGEHKLLLSEVEQAIPKNLTEQDSTNMAHNFIRNWATQYLLLEKAELNLTADQLNVSEKLEEYRRSLLIYLYQKEYIRQQMDTTVSTNEVSRYYEANKENFKLKYDIAQLLFVKLEPTNKDVQKVEDLCLSSKPEHRDELTSYCQQHAIKYILNDQEWTVLNEIIDEIPNNLYSNSTTLVGKGTTVLSDSTGHYILSIKDVIRKNNIAPLEFEELTIKGIILNKRKIDLVKTMERQIFDEGLKKNHVQIK